MNEWIKRGYKVTTLIILYMYRSLKSDEQKQNVIYIKLSTILYALDYRFKFEFIWFQTNFVIQFKCEVNNELNILIRLRFNA